MVGMTSLTGWVAGRVDGTGTGTTMTILKNKGRYPFTVTRPSGYTVGFYNIEWTGNPHPDGTNFVCVVSGEGNGWNDLVNGVGANLSTTSTKTNVAFRKLWQNGAVGQSEALVDCVFTFFIMA